jgi:transcription factor IIIB subunit 2
MTDRCLQCPQCGSRDIDFQESAGQVACFDCGTLLEESTIVSAVEFQETGDRSHLIGQFVSSTRANTAYLNSAAKGRYGFIQESREVTLQAARKAIQQVAAAMKLPAHYTENTTR